MFRGQCVGVTGVDFSIDDFVRPEAASLEETLNRGFIFLDRSGHVDYWSARTRDMLGAFIGRKLETELPAAIAGHIRRLRRAHRAEELPALRRGNAVLRLKFARHPLHEGFLISVEKTEAPDRDHALSAREKEVLEWLGQGKSNAEIGMILGISTHTVKRHVEKVLAKLGVENRYAAAITAQRAHVPA
jgi:DNA-binding CsgD family transcriptional regulator